MEDGSTCTAVCGDGYYLDGGESQLAASARGAGPCGSERACSFCSSRRCRRVQEVRAELPEVLLRLHLHHL